MATINDDQLVERLVPKILSSIRSKAKAVETVPVTQDLTGITSIPCYDTTGEQYRKVLVPVDALREPAQGASEVAMDAAGKASAAADAATQAAAEAADAAVAANEFAGKILLIEEEDYDNAVEAGTLDETKLYFAYKE